MLPVRKLHVNRMMQKCFRSVLAAIPAAAGLAFIGSAAAQQSAGELSRKEWRAHIERAQSRLEQLRQEGKIIDEGEAQSQQSASNREAREEWLARVDEARKRVEQLRASRETSEEEIAVKDADPAPGQPEAANDDIRVGTLPPAGMVRRQLSGSKVLPSGGKPTTRSEPSKQTGLDRDLKPDSRPAKQVRRTQKQTPAGGAARDPLPMRGVQLSNAVVATAASCTSFWGCLKQAVGIR